MKKRWQERARHIRGVSHLAESLRYRISSLRLRRKEIEEVFTEIYRRNEWGSKISVSGSGSDLNQTRLIARELPLLMRELGASSMLDLPCGDFGWMSTVDLSGLHYTGGDIVADLVRSNREKYEASNIRFEVLNLAAGPLPRVDLIFCRDCLPHFSFEDLRRALATVVESGSTYFLTTTFTGRVANRDIATGLWRPLNLQAAPLSLPPPLKILMEGCTEGDGAFGDKALGLWRVSDLREALAGPIAQPP